MPGHQTSLTHEAVAEAVRSVIADVLFVDESAVDAEKTLIVDLGAESIDFLDLVFRLEEVLGKKITASQFDRWIRARLARTGKTGKRDITVAMVTDFALEEAGVPDPS